MFKLRCKSKRGEGLTDDEQALCEAAYVENRARYAAMEKDVFNSTVPYGSEVRRK